MNAYSATSISPPKNWQDFERKSRVLFECILGDPHTQTHGRGGQIQDGVDIFGRRDGGTGRLVGIQCKGKDGNYGGAISEKELRTEIKKTEKFQPPLDEFIVVTTAKDDKKIQEVARLLQQEALDAGRRIAIAVWGWGQIEQHISEHPRAIRAFHPDASPFTDQLLEGSRLVIKGQQETAAQIDYLTALVERRLPSVAAESSRAGTSEDVRLDDEIDQYRDLINKGKSKTALEMLQRVRKRAWADASDRIRFRILTNIGAAFHDLGQYESAADAFIEAAPYDSDNPVAIANRIAGLLIQNERELAIEEVQAAIARFPNRAEVALQLLQIQRPRESARDVWETLSDAVKGNPALVAMFIVRMRNEGDMGWRKEAAQAALANPKDERLRRLLAEATLDEVLINDPGLLGSGESAAVDDRRLRESAEIFESIWQASVKSERGSDELAAHNGALSYLALRNDEQATHLIEQALTSGVATDQTKKLRVMLHLRQGEVAEAIALAQTMKADAERDLGLAELFIESDPKQAQELVRAVSDQLGSEKLQVAAASILVDSFVAERDWASAMAEAKKIGMELPENVAGPLLESRILAAQGNPSAKEVLLRAYRGLKTGSDFSCRLLIARALERAELHDEAAQTLEGFIDERRDSPALRTYLGAAYNADRRATVGNALRGLPASVTQEPYYLWLRAALDLRSGNFAEARRSLRDYLRVRPRDLKMQLHLLLLLSRDHELQELRTELARPENNFDGDPEDWLQLALFLVTYGDWRRAHELAYETWLLNQTNPAVNLRYVGIFVGRPHASEMPLQLDQVEIDAAFGLRAGDERQKFVIERHERLRTLQHTIGPEHPIAVSALGKRVGDQILVRDKEFLIEWIKPKQLDALHHIMETFNLFFPSTDGLVRIAIRDDDPDKFATIFESARQRRESVNSVFDMYERSSLPLAIVARSLGSDPVETFGGLVESGRGFRVCDGTDGERRVALAAVRANEAEGCVVDELTLYLIRRLGIEEVVEGTCGPIGIVAHTIERLQEKREEISSHASEPSLSIGWQDGQAYRMEVSVERKRAALSEIDSDIAWVQSAARVMSAEGKEDAPQELRESIRRFSSGFADEYLAAQGADVLLLSEDMGFRVIGRETFKLRSTWLQPVLMLALQEGRIARQRYNELILEMLKYSSTFISVDAGVLFGCLKEAQNVPLPDAYLVACRALGGPTADVPSHIRVVLDALSLIWDEPKFGYMVKAAATGTIMAALLRGRWDTAVDLVEAMREWGRSRLLNKNIFLGYINGWARGHFITPA